MVDHRPMCSGPKPFATRPCLGLDFAHGHESWKIVRSKRFGFDLRGLFSLEIDKLDQDKLECHF